eukprot:TRINITY_DN3370_c0_g1_i2.p1 TRINITY_DN3370_c0_g1~~TRINITY_DN3370_c0_g1_i2.p1  ORF type:complete len:781 (+),score=334.70 TRINITY_DN3370_c0_g1_i2:79-2421(+)
MFQSRSKEEKKNEEEYDAHASYSSFQSIDENGEDEKKMRRKDSTSSQSDEKKRIEIIKKERKILEEERKKLEKERKSFEEEKKKFMENSLKEKKALEKQRKSLEEEKTKYSSEKEKKVDKAAKKAKHRSILGKKYDDVVVSAPKDFQHSVHVDKDYKWAGDDPKNNFEIQGELGKGAFGAVYKVRHIHTNYVLAAKVMDITEGTEEITKEIEILKTCRSPSIVSYFGTCQSVAEKQLWILMDFCGGGSIRTLIETLERTLTEDEMSFIIMNTLKGLVYLHSSQIIHRDVKAANILVTEEAGVKIADFGVSAQLQKNHKVKDTMGTPLWMAPEVILSKRYDNKCDIWGLGITAIEMADGFPPHYEMSTMRAMKMIPNWPSPTVKDPSQFSSEFNNFVAKCLEKEPSDRPSAVDLLMHPFVMRTYSKGPQVLRDSIAQMMTKRNDPEFIKSKMAEKSDSEEEVSGEEGEASKKSPERRFDLGESFGTCVVNDEVESKLDIPEALKLEDPEDDSKDSSSSSDGEKSEKEEEKISFDSAIVRAINGMNGNNNNNTANSMVTVSSRSTPRGGNSNRPGYAQSEGVFIAEFSAKLESMQKAILEETRAIIKAEFESLREELKKPPPSNTTSTSNASNTSKQRVARSSSLLPPSKQVEEKDAGQQPVKQSSHETLKPAVKKTEPTTTNRPTLKKENSVRTLGPSGNTSRSNSNESVKRENKTETKRDGTVSPPKVPEPTKPKISAAVKMTQQNLLAKASATNVKKAPLSPRSVRANSTSVLVQAKKA